MPLLILIALVSERRRQEADMSPRLGAQITVRRIERAARRLRSPQSFPSITSAVLTEGRRFRHRACSAFAHYAFTHGAAAVSIKKNSALVYDAGAASNELSSVCRQAEVDLRRTAMTHRRGSRLADDDGLFERYPSTIRPPRSCRPSGRACRAFSQVRRRLLSATV